MQSLCWAFKYGHVKICQLLLANKRVNTTTNYNCLSALASSNGHVEVVRILTDILKINEKNLKTLDQLI
jgi:hypothetical protein